MEESNLASRASVTSNMAIYAGSPQENLQAWLINMELTAEWKEVKEEKMVIMAAMNLRGPAMTWFSQNRNELQKWNDFKKAIVQQFAPVDDANQARRDLDRLRQGGGSITDYNAAFRSLLLRIPDMAKADQLHRYLEGLNHLTKSAVCNQNPKDLASAMTIAAGVWRNDATSQPMEVDAIQTTRSQPSDIMELNALQAPFNGECYNCGGWGHKAAQCPSPRNRKNNQGKGNRGDQGQQYSQGGQRSYNNNGGQRL
jgi:hypothetical protein